MFKSKSFDLVNEEKTKKPERLYQPRRMRWLKYIILPAVFAFVLLLILVNVDFSDNGEEVAINSTVLGLHLDREYSWELDTGFDVTTEAIINGRDNSTQQISMAKDPGLAGVTTTPAELSPPSISTTSTESTTTSTLSTSTYSTSTLFTSSISSSSLTTSGISSPITFPTPTTSTTTQSPNCDEGQCQEYACTVPQDESTTISLPYEMILKFKDLKSNTVEVAMSDCESPQMRVIYFTDDSSIGSLDQESLEVMLSNITVGLNCGTPHIYCVMLGGKVSDTPECLPHRTMICEVYSLQTESWFDANGGLVIGLGVVVILISSLLGMLIFYGTLRWKPSLLRRTKLQNGPSRDSNTVVLIPQESEKNQYGIARSPISTLDNNEYIVAYHRYLERANLQQMESNKYITPPRERAPSVPPSCDSSSHLPLPLPLPARNVYESLDLYEELP
ncbi:uncharacterized protein LOC110187967 [Drosophila serrata]|uniref:uncharacterized protein LOC110187967 n=1 Tax=Drosophila serrata TaxID=7274 RepID=UPI000A1D25B2|nr:uncharacterized protein LOC110187967 [Drosophila serrata]